MSYASASAKKGPRGKAVTTYTYRTNGREFFKERFENKTFGWHHWTDGIRIEGTGGRAMTLYHEDEIAAADPTRTLWIAEGEKDCDRLRSLGLLATTAPHGALVGDKQWEPAYTRAVRRLERVHVLEDNDPVGREHAAKVAAALHRLIPNVRVVRLPGLPDHGDVSDWLDGGAEGATAEGLQRIADATPTWTPPEWPEAIPLGDVRGLPDFPTHLLPAPLRNFADAVATEIQTPRCVPAMLSLTVLAAAVARKVALHVRDNWAEPLNLYTATALGPSNLKTPAFKMALAPLETFERVKAAEMRPEIVRGENERANLQARLAAARKAAARAKTEVERRSAIGDTEKLAKKLADLRVARAPQLVANDVTEESLGKLLAENDGRIAVMSDEGGPFRNMAGRYQTNGAPIFETFKHGHNAGTVRVNRIGREPVHVPNATITLGLTVQPAVLRALKQTAEFRGEGLLARFLYAVPLSMVGARDHRAQGVPLHVAEEYRDAIKSLLRLPFGSDQDGATAPHVMEVSADARELLIAFREGLEPRLGRGGDLSHIADWGGKLAGAAARIAGLLHLAKLAGRPEPWRTPVTAEAMEAAVAIVRDFIIPHGLAAFAMIGGQNVELAEEALAWIRRHGAERFTRHDLHRHLRCQVDDPKEWYAPLALLVEHGWIRRVESDPKKKGRPTEEYEVNPAALAGGGAS